MPRLVLLRHGKSDWDTTARTDLDRPLAPRGRKATKRIGDWMARSGHVPDHVIVSPARRTRATWERVAARLGLDADGDSVRIDETVYEASADALLRALTRTPNAIACTLLVGHQPGLEDLTIRLTGRRIPAPHDAKAFPTAAAAVLAFDGSWDELTAGAATLIAMARPRDL